MTDSRAYHHGDLKQALVDATVEIAREEGLDGITMRSVSARAGVSEAAPYHHFATKVDLLAAAAATSFRHFGEALAEGIAVATSEGVEPAVGVARGYVTFAVSNPGEYELLYGRHIVELSIDTRDEVRAAGHAATETSLAAIDASLRMRGSDTSAEKVFPLCRAILHGIVSLVHEKELGSHVTLEEAIELTDRGLTALLDGLTTGTGRSMP